MWFTKQLRRLRRPQIQEMTAQTGTPQWSQTQQWSYSMEQLNNRASGMYAYATDTNAQAQRGRTQRASRSSSPAQFFNLMRRAISTFLRPQYKTLRSRTD